MKFGCVATAAPETLSGFNEQPFTIAETQRRIIAVSAWQTLLRSQNAPCNSCGNHTHSWRGESVLVLSLMAPICTHHGTRSLAAGSLVEHFNILGKWKSLVELGPEQHGAITQEASNMSIQEASNMNIQEASNMNISALLWLCDCVIGFVHPLQMVASPLMTVNKLLTSTSSVILGNHYYN